MADELHIAVASNFASTLNALTQTFSEQTGQKIKVSTGSTGKLYAQIMHGAPFDLFFAADEDRPARLDADLSIIPNSRRTYALGRLVLWSPKLHPKEILNSGDFRYLAIANPKHAPYGAAAQAVLSHKGQWETLQNKVVRGENIAQAFQYVKTGNADLGFIALSQIFDAMIDMEDQYWLVPDTLYPAIKQQVVQLSDSTESTDFLAFVFSNKGQEIIEQHGYTLP
jgi:molybdate transport system substrate-binding protein